MQTQVPWQSLERMASGSVFQPGDKILELGSNIVADIPEGGVEWFVSQVEAAGKTSEAPPGPVAGSSSMPLKALLEKAGLSQQSMQLPPDSSDDSDCDVVLNFGAATRFFDQFEVFKTMHNAVKPGGLLCHGVPTAGVETGSWFNYNPRLFLDVALFNDYGLVDYSIDTTGSEKPFEHAFQDVGWISEIDGPDPNSLKRIPEIENLSLPQLALTIICQKVKDQPFAGAIEIQTSVGKIPDSVVDQYGEAGRGKVESRLLRRVNRLEKELLAIKVATRKGLRSLERIKEMIDE